MRVEITMVTPVYLLPQSIVVNIPHWALQGICYTPVYCLEVSISILYLITDNPKEVPAFRYSNTRRILHDGKENLIPKCANPVPIPAGYPS